MRAALTAPTHPHGSSAVRFHGKRPAASSLAPAACQVLPARSLRCARAVGGVPVGGSVPPPITVTAKGRWTVGVRQDHHAGGGRGPRTLSAPYRAEPRVFPVRDVELSALQTPSRTVTVGSTERSTENSCASGADASCSRSLRIPTGSCLEKTWLHDLVGCSN